MKLDQEVSTKEALTTKYVILDKSPIVEVYYDEDGDWQFFGEEEVDEKDAMIVSVAQILELDPTLKNIPNLKEGNSVYRKNKDSQWQKRI